MSRKHITKIKPRVGLQNRPSVTSDKFKVVPELNNRASRDLKVVSWQLNRKLRIEKDSMGDLRVWLLLSEVDNKLIHKNTHNLKIFISGWSERDRDHSK